MQYSAEVRGLFKCLPGQPWVSFETLEGLTNGDLSGEAGLTAASSASAMSLARLHLIADAGSDAVGLYGSSLRPGARPHMDNALYIAFTIGSGIDRGDYTFSTYAAMPIRAQAPNGVERMEAKILRYYLLLYLEVVCHPDLVRCGSTKLLLSHWSPVRCWLQKSLLYFALTPR